MSKIKDLFNGKILECWEDGELIYLSFPWVTVNFPKESWEEVKKELKQLGDV